MAHEVRFNTHQQIRLGQRGAIQLELKHKQTLKCQRTTPKHLQNSEKDLQGNISVLLLRITSEKRGNWHLPVVAMVNMNTIDAVYLIHSKLIGGILLFGCHIVQTPTVYTVLRKGAVKIMTLKMCNVYCAQTGTHFESSSR